MSLEILSLILFIGIIIAFVYFDRKNIEFKYGLVMRRTKKGKKFIYRMAKRYKKWLILLGNLGIIVGIVASGYTFFSLIDTSYKIFFKPKEAAQSIALVFPSVSGVKLPGFVLGIPFWYWIIGIFTVMIAHEPMHGLLARAENVRIKSLGVLLLIAIPGAFVEPDEKQIKKLSTMKKLRIYAAGSFGNFILAAILLFLTLAIIYPIFYRGSVIYGYLNYTKYNRSEPFPAERANITGPILSIDEERVENVKDLQRIMADKKPGQTILVKTTKGTYSLTLTNDPKNKTKGYMGVFVADYKVLKREYRDNKLLSTVLSYTVELMGWIVTLNLGIGAANLLPIKPLDGGLMFEEIIKRFFKRKKRREKIVNLVSILTIILIVIALFGPSIVKNLT